MTPTILRNEETSQKVLEFVADVPSGRRALAKLGRTCKAFFEPAMNVLWKDLDSLVPIIGLFPSHLLRRAKRPGLGLAKNPLEEDWTKVLEYGDRVKKLTYNESLNNVSPSIFPIIEEFRPRQFILPNLEALHWKCETPAGLDRALLFVTPTLGHLVLEVGMRVPRFETVLAELAKRAKLRSLSLSTPAALPDSFTEVMRSQDKIEKLALSVPGALSAGTGRWIASLPHLRSLQLDLTARSAAGIESFFEDTGSRSGSSTPGSIGATDSGVFSGGEEVDVVHDLRKRLRKSSVRLSGDHARMHRTGAGGAFAQLEDIQLNGSASNVAAFLKHLRGDHVVSLELAIEDPPVAADWQELCQVLSERFGYSLQSLRISATASSRPELIRTTSRGDITTSARPLTLKYLSGLTRLARLDIDLPTSVIFNDSDIEQLAAACPNVEILKLCPTARFPLASGPPTLTLEGLAPLASGCSRLRSLAVVVNAVDGSEDILGARGVSSNSITTLNLGHSWVKDPLSSAILLSQLAPRLDLLKYFHDASRPGYVAAHATVWQKAVEFLPQLQRLRLTERAVAAEELERYKDENPSYFPQELDLEAEEPVAELETAAEPEEEFVVVVEKLDKEVDATMVMVHQFATAKPSLNEEGVQSEPEVIVIPVETVPKPDAAAIPLEAVPELVSAAANAESEVHEAYQIGETYFFPSPELKHAEPKGFATPAPTPKTTVATNDTARRSVLYFVPSVGGVISSARNVFFAYPIFLSLLLLQSSLGMIGARKMPIQRPVPQPQEQEEMMVSSDEEEEAPLPRPAAESLHQSISPEYAHAVPSPILAINSTASSDNVEGVKKSSNAPLTEPKVQLAEHVNELGECISAERASRARDENAWLAAVARERAFSKTRTPTPTIRPSPAWIMSEKKQEKDFTKEVDELLPEAIKLAESGKLQEGLDKIFVLEKQTRNAADLKSTTRLLQTATDLAYQARDYTTLNSMISILSKKHGQLKGAVQAMVEQAIGWLDTVKEREGTEKWLELIETLRAVTEGKIFLETPRARVTLLLSHYHEGLSKDPSSAPSTSGAPPSSKDSLQTASDLLSDLQVETYSSMDRREKTQFILEQMRLLIAVARAKDEEVDTGKKDALGGGEAEWVRVRVGGRKVNEEFLKEKENEDLKLKYYDLMIQHALYGSAYLDCAKYYYKVWETPSIKEDVDDKGKAALEHIAYYIVLAPHDNEQSDMLHRLFVDPALSKLELQYNLVKCFTTPELMRWPGIEGIYGPFLRTTNVFQTTKRWEDLHTRVVEHNIRVVSQYYTRITLARLTSLLDLTRLQTEETLSRLVVSGTIYARIDRLAGIIDFRAKRNAENVMNDWSSDMQKLLSLVEKTWMGMNAALAAQSRGKA